MRRRFWLAVARYAYRRVGGAYTPPLRFYRDSQTSSTGDIRLTYTPTWQSPQP